MSVVLSGFPVPVNYMELVRTARIGLDKNCELRILRSVSDEIPQSGSRFRILRSVSDEIPQRGSGLL
jgi:hypothetical protein